MLSAREERIITEIEQRLVLDDPWWAARFDRLTRTRHPKLRRGLVIGGAVLMWATLVCADAANGRGPLLWIALCVGPIMLFVLTRLRRRRHGLAHGDVGDTVNTDLGNNDLGNQIRDE